MREDASPVPPVAEFRPRQAGAVSRRATREAALRALIVDQDPHSRAKLRGLLDEELDVDVAAECDDGWNAVRAIESLGPDVVFLDVALPKLDGFGILENVEPERVPSVVFVTADERHALRAFEVRAADYLLKPFGRERLQVALDRVRKEVLGDRPVSLRARLSGLGPGRYLRRIVVKRDGRLLLLKTDDVDWIESSGNYLRIHAGDACHTVRQSLGTMEQLLDPEQFLRIHRSTIVNADRILEMRSRLHGDYRVVLRDGTELTLSAMYRRKLAEHTEAASPD